MRLKSLILLVALLAALGCGSTTIIGTWESDVLGNKVTCTFKEDKSYTMEGEIEGGKVIASGTYNFDGKSLTMIADKLETPIKDQYMRDQFLQHPGVQALNQTFSGAVSFSDNSKFEYNTGGEKKIFTRVVPAAGTPKG